jgi:hypothetical protein
VRYFDYGAGKTVFSGGEKCEDEVKTEREENFGVWWREENR